MPYYYLLCFLAFSPVLHGQADDCACRDALAETWAHLSELPAFEDNCGANSDCTTRYQQLLTEAPRATSGLPCYRLLTALTGLLGDGHTAIYGMVPDTLPAVASPAGRPLRSPPEGEAPVGTYYGEGYTLGLTKGTEHYVLRILASPRPRWAVGDTVAYLVPRGAGRYRFSGHRLSDGRLITFSEVIRDGSFSELGFRRDTTVTDRSHYTGTATYAYARLEGGIDYLRLGSFSSYNPELSEAEAFYATVAGQLVGRLLLVDLRDNTGGGKRNSNIIYKILRQQRRRYDRIGVLINHGSISNAEQFALRLKEWPEVSLLGEATQGVLTYELEGAAEEVGCGQYLLQMATKRLSRYLPYEGSGVAPDVRLGGDSDWIEQATRRLLD